MARASIFGTLLVTPVNTASKASVNAVGTAPNPPLTTAAGVNQISIASTSANPSGVTPDLTLINELFEAIEQHPPAIEARKVLLQQYIELGWLDAAGDVARDLLKIDPSDADATASLILCQGAAQPPSVPSPVTVPRYHPPPLPVELPEDLESAKVELSEGYEALRNRAKALQREARLLRALQQKKGISSRCDKHLPDLTALADGRISTVLRAPPPRSARSVARAMEVELNRALDIATTDLSDMARWLRSSASQSLALDNDAVREALAKRVSALIAALPEGLQHYASSALMHVEHEVLQRTYVSNETMLGDPVADIPREHFWVSEDGYAWDMEELAQALTSNSGVMRNPLSRQLFTTNDIRAIVQHPLGKGLSALQIEQSRLSQGVRPKTVEQLDSLATTLLADMSADQIPSRHAVDEFLAYVATLPEAEQKAIGGLRVPAKDTHTNQPFDTSIGEAVRDAQGNRVCFHKTGDFLRQAARHLRQKR